MAYLLKFYQRMRLIRERNETDYELIKMSGKISRQEKKIKNRQKYWEGQKTALQSQAKQMESNGKVQIQSWSGLGVNDVNLSSMFGVSTYVQNATWEYIKQGCSNGVDSNGQANPRLEWTGDQSTFQTLMNYYNNNGNLGTEVLINEDDSSAGTHYVNPITKEEVCTKDNYKLFMYALNAAKQQQTMASNNVNQACSNYSNNVSIWLDAQMAMLEAQQDAELEPLNYEQTMWEMDKEYLEAKAERIKQELEALNLKDEVDKVTPHFGLA